MSRDSILEILVAKLDRLSPLDEAERRAVRALPYSVRPYQPSAYLVREGEALRNGCSLILSGYAYGQKLTAEGARQIVSIHMAGDLPDTQHLFLDVADHNIQALTPLEVAEIPRSALQELVLTRRNVARAVWIDTLIAMSICREWVMNVGRRDARARMAHFLCELVVRMRAAGLVEADGGYRLPMTQEQLGDAVGLTSVHVNRTLKSLVTDGMVRLDRRMLWIVDWNAIRAEGEFSTLYLHPDQAGMAAARV